MNTFKFNTEDTSQAKTSEFPYPKELKEEDKFLAELLAEVMPSVRAVQAQEGGQIPEEKRTKILSEVKKVFELEIN